MDRIHQIHRAFSAGNLLAVFGGLAYKETSIDLNVIILSVILILIRAKFWFDDEAYLDDVSRGVLPGGLPFGFGMFLAVASWIAWGFAGFFIKDLETTSVLMLVVLATSTFWIVAAMVKRGSYAEQVPWLFFNCLYALGFGLIAWRTQPWNPFAQHSTGFTTAALAYIAFVFIVDLGVTRILEQKRRGSDIASSRTLPMP